MPLTRRNFGLNDQGIYVPSGGGDNTGFSDKVLTYSPQVYLKMNDTSGTQLTDSSGNARHGTKGAGGTLGGDSLTPYNPSGKSLVASGTGVRATIPGTNVATPTGDISFGIIIKPTLTGVETTVIRKDTVINFGIWTDNTPFVQIDQSTSSAFAQSTTPLVSGTTYFFVLTFNDATNVVRIYKNGALDPASGTGAGNRLANTNTVYLGSDSAAGTRMNGNIDEFFVIPSNLSAANVTELNTLLNTA